MSSQWLWQHAQDPYKLKSGRSQHEGQGVGVEHTLNQGAIRTDTYWERESYFLQYSDSVYQLYFSTGPMFRSSQPVQTGLHDLFVLKERGNMTWKKVREGNEYNPNTVLRIFKE